MSDQDQAVSGNNQQELIKQLQKTIDELRLDNASLRATLDKLQKMLFAPHSEKTRTKDFPGQMSLFDEAESEADPSAKEPPVSTLVEGYARKKTGSRWAFRSQGQQWPTGSSRPVRIISSLSLKQCTDISLNADLSMAMRPRARCCMRKAADHSRNLTCGSTVPEKTGSRLLPFMNTSRAAADITPMLFLKDLMDFSHAMVIRVTMS